MRLGIYYGYPSLVNGAAGRLERAAAVFGDYDVVVLGDGLEFGKQAAGGHAEHEEHAFTVQLLQELAHGQHRPEVYGYVDLGRTEQLKAPELAERIALWRQTGADGVFLDEAGYDFGVTRERQNAAVLAAHASGLRVLLNAFQPRDVFDDARVPLNRAGGGNPRGLPAALTVRDALLLESFAVREGTPETAEEMRARTEAALEARARFGTRVFAIATSSRAPLSDDLAVYGWWAAAIFGVDAYGRGAPSFSAVSSELPSVPQPVEAVRLRRASYGGELRAHGDTWRRATSAGTIALDLAHHTGMLEAR